MDFVVSFSRWVFSARWIWIIVVAFAADGVFVIDLEFFVIDFEF